MDLNIFAVAAVSIFMVRAEPLLKVDKVHYYNEVVHFNGFIRQLRYLDINANAMRTFPFYLLNFLLFHITQCTVYRRGGGKSRAARMLAPADCAVTANAALQRRPTRITLQDVVVYEL